MNWCRSRLPRQAPRSIPAARLHQLGIAKRDALADAPLPVSEAPQLPQGTPPVNRAVAIASDQRQIRSRPPESASNSRVMEIAVGAPVPSLASFAIPVLVGVIHDRAGRVAVTSQLRTCCKRCADLRPICRYSYGMGRRPDLVPEPNPPNGGQFRSSFALVGRRRISPRLGGTQEATRELTSACSSHRRVDLGARGPRHTHRARLAT